MGDGLCSQYLVALDPACKAVLLTYFSAACWHTVSLIGCIERRIDLFLSVFLHTLPSFLSKPLHSYSRDDAHFLVVRPTTLHVHNHKCIIYCRWCESRLQMHRMPGAGSSKETKMYKANPYIEFYNLLSPQVQKKTLEDNAYDIALHMYAKGIFFNKCISKRDILTFGNESS